MPSKARHETSNQGYMQTFRLERRGLLIAVGVATAALLTADVSAGRSADDRRDRQVTIDCAQEVRKRDPRVLAESVRPLPPDARRRCVAQLIQLVEDVRNSFLAEYAAQSIEALAQQGLVENSDGILAPFIACEQQGTSSLPMYCNRVLEALTKHAYGRAMFAGQAGAPPRTAENVALNVADWTEYERLYGSGHPVFDEWLAEKCVRALADIGGRLVKVLSESTPSHPAIGYVNNLSRLSVETLRVFGERVFSLGLGEMNLGRGFALPGNWMSVDGLRGIRIVAFRPGIAQPSFPERIDADIHAFPTDVADYRERFDKLDLEVRFQIVTPNVELRQRSTSAIKDGLGTLRAADSGAGR